MSGKSAQTFGLERRGLIKINYFADIVIFDPNKIIDEATYEKPLTPSSGVDFVLNNGKLVWNNLIPTNQYVGKFLEGKVFT